MKKPEYIPNELMIDHKLHHWLRHKIHNSEFSYPLRTLENCGKLTIPDLGATILSNGTEAKIFGNQFCDNSWLCPICTPRRMSKFAAKITCAIDALARQKKAAIMITFTQFHTRSISCADLFETIVTAYTNMIKSANWKRKKKWSTENGRNQSNNVKGEYYTSNGDWNNFIAEFNIRHTIKSLEVTYGKHGWHPHYHVLFFIDENRLNEVLNWQDKIIKVWNKYLLKAQKKIITADKYPTQAKVFFSLQEKYFKNVANGNIKHQGCFISTNEDGTIHRVSSGNYLSGWGGDDELAGTPNLKTANEGHFTPMELLYKAYTDNDEEAWKIWLELALTLHNKRRNRVDFSRTGLKQIIDNWMQTNEYKEEVKKNTTEIIRLKGIKPFHSVAWFTSQQWLEICYLDRHYDYPIILLILTFANYENGYELICELMHSFNLSPPLKEHPAINVTEMFNYLCGLIPKPKWLSEQKNMQNTLKEFKIA